MGSISEPAMADRTVLTGLLAQTAPDYRALALHADTLTVATQCIIDWLAVVLPGALNQYAILVAEELKSTGHGPCTAIGRGCRLSAQDAALANGDASHAPDLDDVNRTMQGHPYRSCISAAGLLLDIDEAQIVNAIGLAATQAAGLKGDVRQHGKAAANCGFAARR